MPEQQLMIQNIYSKSLTYECYNTPHVFYQGLTLKPNLQLSFSINKINEDLYEVVMVNIITTTADVENSEPVLIYKIEASKAGLFRVSGYEGEELDEILNINCPSILFPYLRQEIDNLIHYSGFPSFAIQPVSFYAIYEDKKAQEKAKD